MVLYCDFVKEVGSCVSDRLYLAFAGPDDVGRYYRFCIMKAYAASFSLVNTYVLRNVTFPRVGYSISYTGYKNSFWQGR